MAGTFIRAPRLAVIAALAATFLSRSEHAAAQAAPAAVAAPTAVAVPLRATGGTLTVVDGAEAAPAAQALQTPEAAVAQQIEAAATQAKQQRQQKLGQLQFDRRPSAYLKAWAGLTGTKAAPPQAPQQPADATQKPQLTPEQEAAQKEAQAFDEALKTLQRNVTLGAWADVKAFFATLEAEDARIAYQRMLASLQQGPAAQQANLNQDAINQMMLQGGSQAELMGRLAAGGQGAGAQLVEKNVFAPADLVGIIAAAPNVPDPPLLDKAGLAQLGALVRQTLARGHQLAETLATLAAAKGDEDQSLLNPRQLAQVLFAAGQDVAVGPYLPTLEEAQANNDREGLNLLARHFLALYGRDEKIEQLERAWAAIQAALAAGDVDQEAKEESLRRAVEIAPKVRTELGQAWLDESFTAHIDRGQEILATIGAGAAINPQSRPSDAATRLRELQLQKTAVEALLKAAPDQAGKWRDVLALLAGTWLREAELSQQFDRSQSFGPRMLRDPFGNYFFQQEETNQRQQGIVAITTAQVLEVRPGDQWLALVADSQRPAYLAQFARLYLKVQEEGLAFPYIERVAATHTEVAHSLCEEFLRVWTSNHNPNESRDRTSIYMWSWGYERRAESIPLTRSKQERNLAELADWIKRLKALPIAPLDEKLLARAFMVSHSEAEVYRLESIERVFGSLDALEPATLAELIQAMRVNLASVWQKPDVQKRQGTKRREKDIQAEVLRGFEVARQVLDRALAKYGDDWRLNLALASVLHDEVVYRNELSPSPEFLPQRREALARFAQAAEMYAQGALTRARDDESVEVYQTWYYASFGAVDLGRIKPESVADTSQPAKIREAMLALPGEAADRHVARFANDLFTRLSAASPALKFRFLRGGFEIVGDHRQAHEARKVYDYYKDLVTEIKLAARIDGADTVGHGQPFGVFIDLQHTKEIERESGGFAKYLQNQNQMYFSYNYGRPTENYRDKFKEGVQAALQEQFEVVSVTFNDAETTSKALPEYGWRVTPYAYLLLKAKGPQVDRLPPVKLDLDFLDTSGYVILPVESQAVPLDASPESPVERTPARLDLVQTLDERQAKDGKLILEIKATARGLVPELDVIVDPAAPGFDVVNVDDQGLSVTQFDKESDETQIVSERLWTVTYAADPKLTKPPTLFAFPDCKLADVLLTRQRYDDADMVAAEATVPLVAQYGGTSYAWAVWAGVGALALVAGVLLAARRLRRPAEDVERKFQVPSQVTPFTVLGLLENIQHNNGLNEAGHRELSDTIDRLQKHYFVEPAEKEPDLAAIATSWVQRCG